MNTESLNVKQIYKLFICSLVADAILLAFNASVNFSAHEKVLAAIINTAILTVLVTLLFCNISPKKSYKFWLITASASFIFSAAGAFLNIERFYRFASDIHLDGFVIILIVLLIAIYTLNCNFGALARASGLFILMFAVFGLLLVVISADKASVLNLQPSFKDKYGVFTATVMTFKFPSSLLLYAVLQLNENSEQTDKQKLSESTPETSDGIADENVQLPLRQVEASKKIDVKSMIKGIFVLFAIQVVLAIFAELVFGSKTTSYSQPIYATIQMGRLSVFEHLEPVFFFVWLLAILTQGIILFFASFHTLKNCFVNTNTKVLKIVLLIITFGAIVGVSFLSQIIYSAVSIMLAAFSACMLSIRARSTKT